MHHVQQPSIQLHHIYVYYIAYSIPEYIILVLCPWLLHLPFALDLNCICSRVMSSHFMSYSCSPHVTPSCHYVWCPNSLFSCFVCHVYCIIPCLDISLFPLLLSLSPVASTFSHQRYIQCPLPPHPTMSCTPHKHLISSVFFTWTYSHFSVDQSPLIVKCVAMSHPMIECQ